MKEEPHLIDVLLNVPVTTKPILICELLLDSIEPLFGRVIHCGLINKRKKCLARFIPEGTGMRENNINFPIDLVQGLCHLRFDFFRRLLNSLLLYLLYQNLSLTAVSPQKYIHSSEKHIHIIYHPMCDYKNDRKSCF